MRFHSIATTCLILYAVSATHADSARARMTFTKEQLQLPGKKGVCFTLRDPEKAEARGTWDQNIKKVKALNPSWNYSWGGNRVPPQPDSIEFIPMAWSGGKNISEWLQEQVVPQIKNGTAKRFLGFNEPDKKDQANMPYMKAIELWPELMKLGVPLCSPACANPEGINDNTAQEVPGTWMQDFMREADKRSYRVDYVGVHFYGGASAKLFKTKMKRIYEKYGKRPLLITEFAPADWKAKTARNNRHSKAAVLKFMKAVLPWMEQQDWIAGYAWFSFNIDSPPGTSSALFDEKGNLTACGKFYKSVTPSNPSGDQRIKPD